MVKFLHCVLTSSILALLIANTSFAQAQLVKDINTTPANATESGRTFCQCGDYLFFAANTEEGRELWRTDGTSVGTIPLGDIYNGILNGYAKGDMVCDQNNIIYFTGDDGHDGFDVWKSDCDNAI